MTGERRCNSSVSAIKIHTQSDLEHFYRVHAIKDCELTHRNAKCCELWRKTSRSAYAPLVVLSRHPFAAFFSEFQRSFYALNPTFREPSQASENTHTATLPRARLAEILPIWEKSVTGLANNWKDFCVAYQRYAKTPSAPAHASHAPRPRPVIVRYEDLKDVRRRQHALRVLVGALRLPLPRVPDEALMCAFEAAEHRSVHRPADGVDGGRIVLSDLYCNATLMSALWDVIGKCATSIGYSLPLSNASEIR